MPTRVVNKMPTGVDEIYDGDQRVMFEGGKRELVKNSTLKNSSVSDDESSSSCIGNNSDVSENFSEKSGDCDEVQSSYKGPLDAMEALEQVLPIRRGISRFYNGKSKSFASLAETSSSSSSIKEIAKPENAYMRKRRNLLACNLVWDKSRSSPLRGNGGGISKRVTSSSRTNLALAVAMSNSDSEKQAESDGRHLPNWRSFSLADLQQCAAVVVGVSNSNEITAKPS